MSDGAPSMPLGDWSDKALAALRIVTAMLFLAHGTQKIFGFPSPYRYGAVEPWSLIGLAGGLELVGGVLVLLGVFARPVAFVLSGQMAVAYFVAHAGRGLHPIDNGGETAILFCFIFLLISAAGAGAWSVDGMRAARGDTSRR